MLIPSRHLLASTLLMLLAALAASIWPGLLTYFLAAAAAIALIAAVDALLLLRAPLPKVARHLPHAWPLGVGREVKLAIEPAGGRGLAIRLYDHLPPAFETEDLPLDVRIAAGATATLRYRGRPVERGEHRFERCELRIASPLRLWQRRAHAAEPVTVKVYPNFAALTRYALFATDHRLSQLGALKRRRRGLGLDFHQLREYREGDTQRQIDWKATARMGRLISREYQDERDQQIMILLDCGRRMAARDGALSHMDHVLNAVMLLSYVGLRQGDAVGLMTLGGVQQYFPPRKSLATVNALMNQIFDLQPTLDAPDFYNAATELTQRLTKRALVVVVSNLRDEDEGTLMPALSLLRRRHLLLVASLRERILMDALQQPVKTLDDALGHAASTDYLERRRASFSRLEASGYAHVDVEPEGLPMALVNRYIDLKRSGRL